MLALAIAWTAAEWLRGNILTGFPMNLMGTVWMPSVGMIQSVAVVGVYGLSFVTVLAAAAPAALATPGTDEHPGRRPWLLPAVAFGLLAAVWLGGQARLALAPDHAPTEVTLRLVQASIDQSRKWEEGLREAGLAHHVVLSHEPGLDETDIVIWPETAAPFFLDESPTLQAFVSRAAPFGGYVITGAPRRTRSAGRTIAVWNSLHVLGSAGTITASYDKHHLVPFGEYMPLRGIINLRALATGAVDSSAGPGPRTLRPPGVPPFSPLICYEAIFPGEVVADDLSPAERPQWLLNVTNDAWFGHTAGPYQHFQAARLRAVEEGMPLVRAANTGISAVVDSYGRVVGRLGLGEIGVLDAPLPPALEAPPPTARLGGWILAILLLVAAAATLAIGLRHWSRGRRRGQGA